MDEIIVLKVNRNWDRKRNIQCKSSFFETAVIIRAEATKVVFKKPNIDYTGTTHKFKLNKSGYYTTIAVADLPLGVFKIDEYESNQDQLVAYF